MTLRSVMSIVSCRIQLNPVKVTRLASQLCGCCDIHTYHSQLVVAFKFNCDFNVAYQAVIPFELRTAL